MRKEQQTLKSRLLCLYHLAQEYKLHVNLFFSLLLSSCTPLVSSPADPYSSAIATTEAQTTSVTATDTAKTPETLAFELDKFPPEVRNSTGLFYLTFINSSGNLEARAYTTAILIDYLPEKDIYIGLTAAHPFRHESATPSSGFIFETPALGITSFGDFLGFKPSLDPELDYSLFAFKDQTHANLQVLGYDRVLKTNTPEYGVNYLSLGFPQAASLNRVFPQTLSLIDNPSTRQYAQEHGLFTTSAVQSGGASGSPVITSDGMLLGILPSRNPYGAVLSPLGENFETLWTEFIQELTQVSTQ